MVHATPLPQRSPRGAIAIVYIVHAAKLWLPWAATERPHSILLSLCLGNSFYIPAASTHAHAPPLLPLLEPT